MKCAFIISPSYSGSTMLSMLLAHHPELSTLGEFLDARERRYRKGEGDFCSCGEKLSACPHMAKLAALVESQRIPFSVDRPDTAFYGEDLLSRKVLESYIRKPSFEMIRGWAISLLPRPRGIVKRIAARNSVVIASILQLEGTSVYLDSAKNNNRVIYFDRYAPDIDVKVIWLVRDGRGVTNSIMKHYGIGIGPATAKWITAQRSVMRAATMIDKDKVLRISYEDLCSTPDRILPSILEHLELEPQLLPGTFGDAELHLTGNNMRLNGLAEIRLDQKWERELTEPQLAHFQQVGGRLNSELGYT